MQVPETGAASADRVRGAVLPFCRLLGWDACGKCKLAGNMGLSDKIVGLHRKHRILSHVLFWIAVFLVSNADDSYQSGEGLLYFNTYSFYALSLVTQIGTAYFLAYFIIPEFFKTKKYLLVFLYFLLGMYAICVVSRMINIYIREPMVGIAAKDFETIGEILTNLPKLFYIYFFRNFSIAVVFLFIKLLIDQFEVQRKALTLEKQKAETELKLLKTQLNPHFLFNTLNNIYSLSLLQSPVAPTAIARLSEILDYMLYRVNDLFVPLSGEIGLLNNYIGLEKLRYDERLLVNFTNSVDREVRIAPLLLLSIVENAFKHGAGTDTGSPRIDIDLSVAGPVFRCRVANSRGRVMGSAVVGEEEVARGEAGSEKNKDAIGLPNIRQQLGLIYPQKHDLVIEEQPDRFIVTLDILYG